MSHKNRWLKISGSSRIAFGFLFVFSSVFFLDIASASAGTRVSGDISGHVVWTKTGGTYIADNLRIPSGASLTIEPGTIVKVPRQAYAITLAGGSLVIGAADAEIVRITSLEDDSVGINEDGAASVPAKGDWYALRLTSGTASIERAHISYGGYDNRYGQLVNDGAEVVISQSDFSDTYTNIVANGGMTDIHDCHIWSSSYFGIRHSGGMLRFAQNAFDGKMSAAMYSSGGESQDGGGNTSESAYASIGSTRNSGHSIIAKGLVYSLSGLGIAGSASLDILPGSIIKTASIPLNISGGTVSVGADEGEEVIITSSKDDAAGGDTNGNGALTSPAPGNWQGIIVSGGNLILRNTRIRYGGYNAFSQYSQLNIYGGTATLSGVHLSESLDGHIYQMGGMLDMADSEMTGAQYGLVLREGNASIHTSSIHDIVQYGIQNLAQTTINASNNWWGDASGPWHTTYTSGLGVKLEGNIDFAPWKGCFRETCHSSVLFLPGLEASHLSSVVDQYWEPHGNADAEALYLNEDGRSINQSIRATGILRNAYFPVKGDIYESFSEEMDKMKNVDHLIADWKAVPYDWRLSLDDIVSHGTESALGGVSYIEETSSPYILEELRRLAADSNTGKVTIIAHSNGGLVAKALIKKLGDTEAAALIDKVVLVAVPQDGTPQAIGAILHGYDQGLPVDWMSFFFSPKTARSLAHNMPGAYHLLPSAAYFSGEGSGVETPVIEFEDDGDATRFFIGKYGHKIDSVAELEGFLSESEKKVAPDSDILTSPSTINNDLLAYGKDIHSGLDDMAIPESIEVYQIAGFGEETLGTVRYWTEKVCLMATNDGSCVQSDSRLAFTPEMVIDGDGTVAAPSALAMSTSQPNMKRYWVDLDDYNNSLPGSLLHFSRKHADILEIQELRGFVSDIITQSVGSLPEYVVPSEPSITSEKRLRYYLHSPLVLSAKDSEGREVSVSKSDIPGARYRRFGEVQYISLPAAAHPTIVLDGESDGSFTLEVQEVEGEVILSSTTFTGIPSVADTRVEMSFPDGSIEGSGPLVIDYNGDGTEEHELAPVLNGTVTLDQPTDTIPPTTSTTITGTPGTNGWYVSDTIVTLTATDDMSGIEKTEYSINGGALMIYSGPFILSDEGIVEVKYFSTDKQGNQESEKIQTIKIDKTDPEAKVSFNPITQKLDISGTDALSDVSIITINKPEMVPSNKKVKNIKAWFSRWHNKNKKNLPDMLATLTDEAGHTTSLTFEKTKDRRGFIFVRLLSLGYDGEESLIRDTDATYKWKVDRKGEYQLFATSIKIGESTLESHYIPKKDETWIMEKSEALKDDDRDEESERDERDRNNERNEDRSIKTKLPGMAVLYVESENGKINIKY